MIRKRPNAENTMKGSVPQNVYWNLTRNKQSCMYCGRIHDGANRVLDERGKLMIQPARQDITGATKVCPLSADAAATRSRTPSKKANRMLGTENERLSRLPRK